MLPITMADLACPLEGTRFVPFGYKDVSVEPAVDSFSPPATLEWQIPERFISLQQVKFVWTASKGKPTSPERSS